MMAFRRLNMDRNVYLNLTTVAGSGMYVGRAVTR